MYFKSIENNYLILRIFKLKKKIEKFRPINLQNDRGRTKRFNCFFFKTIPILRWKVELQRGPSGFGFGLRGGRDHNLPFYILRVAPQVFIYTYFSLKTD